MTSQTDSNYSKIAIVGCPGSGKSTLARMLATKLGVPLFHLDAFMWKQNWQPRSDDEVEAEQGRMLENTSWIIDGNFSNVWKQRFDQATTIIHLDYTAALCVSSIILRRLSPTSKNRSCKAKGCHEKLDKQFFRYTLRFRKDTRPMLIEQLKGYNGKVITFTNRKQAKQWLATIK